MMAEVAVLSELPGITEVDWSGFCVKQRLVLVLGQPQDLWARSTALIIPMSRASLAAANCAFTLTSLSLSP